LRPAVRSSGGPGCLLGEGAPFRSAGAETWRSAGVEARSAAPASGCLSLFGGAGLRGPEVYRRARFQWERGSGRRRRSGRKPEVGVRRERPFFLLRPSAPPATGLMNAMNAPPAARGLTREDRTTRVPKPSQSGLISGSYQVTVQGCSSRSSYAGDRRGPGLPGDRRHGRPIAGSQLNGSSTRSRTKSHARAHLPLSECHSCPQPISRGMDGDFKKGGGFAPTLLEKTTPLRASSSRRWNSNNTGRGQRGWGWRTPDQGVVLSTRSRTSRASAPAGCRAPR